VSWYFQLRIGTPMRGNKMSLMIEVDLGATKKIIAFLGVISKT